MAIDDQKKPADNSLFGSAERAFEVDNDGFGVATNVMGEATMPTLEQSDAAMEDVDNERLFSSFVGQVQSETKERKLNRIMESLGNEMIDAAPRLFETSDPTTVVASQDPAQMPKDASILDYFGQVRRGVGTGSSMIGEGLTQFGFDITGDLLKQYGEHEIINSPEKSIESVFKIKGTGDLANFIWEAGTEAIGTSLPAIAGTVVAGPAGMYGAGAAMGIGDVRSNFLDEREGLLGQADAAAAQGNYGAARAYRDLATRLDPDNPENDKLIKAFGVAVGSLDAFALSKVLEGVPPSAFKNFKSKLVRFMAVTAANAGAGAVREGFTEALQAGLSIMAVARAQGVESAMGHMQVLLAKRERLIEEGAAGAAGGLLLGTVSRGREGAGTGDERQGESPALMDPAIQQAQPRQAPQTAPEQPQAPEPPKTVQRGQPQQAPAQAAPTAPQEPVYQDPTPEFETQKQEVQTQVDQSQSTLDELVRQAETATAEERVNLDAQASAARQKIDAGRQQMVEIETKRKEAVSEARVKYQEDKIKAEADKQIKTLEAEIETNKKEIERLNKAVAAAVDEDGKVSLDKQRREVAQKQQGLQKQRKTINENTKRRLEVLKTPAPNLPNGMFSAPRSSAPSTTSNVTGWVPQVGMAKKMPKPKSLVDFLRTRGGIRDDQGELRNIDARAVWGLQKNKKGLPLDKARELAVQAGYLQDVQYDDVTQSSVDDLIQALDNEINRGEKVYSSTDETLVNDLLAAEQIDQENADILPVVQEIQGWYAQQDLPYDLSEPEVRQIYDRMKGGLSLDEAIEEVLKRSVSEPAKMAAVRASAGFKSMAKALKNLDPTTPYDEWPQALGISGEQFFEYVRADQHYGNPPENHVFRMGVDGRAYPAPAPAPVYQADAGVELEATFRARMATETQYDGRTYTTVKEAFGEAVAALQKILPRGHQIRGFQDVSELPPMVQAEVRQSMRMGRMPDALLGMDGHIYISMDALAPMQRVKHETVHLLRKMGLWTELEWNALVSEAKRRNFRYGPVVSGRTIDEVYGPVYSAALERQYGMVDKGMLNEMLDEEAVAHMAEQQINGGFLTGVDYLIDRMTEFLAMLRNALANKGFRTSRELQNKLIARQALRDMVNGRIAQRRPTASATGETRFAISGKTSSQIRGEAGKALRDGKKFEVNREVYTALAETMQAYMHSIPPNVRTGAVARLEPLWYHPAQQRGDDTLVTILSPDGTEFQLPAPRAQILLTRAFYSPRHRALVLFDVTLDGAAGLDDSVRGRVYHELIHGLRHSSALSGEIWNRLLSHGTKLKIYGMKFREIAEKLNHEDWQTVDEKLTLGQLYNWYYRDADPDRREELLDQEIVAHMIELYSHGALTAQQMKPIQDILDQFIDGSLVATSQPARSGSVMASFAGPLALTADQSRLVSAHQLEAQGVAPEEIYRQTGWLKRKDGKWRFEIDDSQVKFRFYEIKKPWAFTSASKDAVETAELFLDQENGDFAKSIERLDQIAKESRVAENAKRYSSAADLLRSGQIRINRGLRETKDRWSDEKSYYFSGPLSEALDAPQLYAAYPQLKSVKLRIGSPTSLTGGGSFSRENRQISVVASGDLESIMRTLMHEVQHAIQMEEGFEGGGNSSTLASRTRVALFELTQQLAQMRPGSNMRYELEKLRLRLQHQADQFSGGISGWSVTNQEIDAYERVLGEVEARNVELRLRYSAKQRAESFPLSTEDIPQDEQYAGGELIALDLKNDKLIDDVVADEIASLGDMVDRIDYYGPKRVIRYFGISLSPAYQGDNRPKPIRGGRSNVSPSMDFSKEGIAKTIKTYGVAALREHIAEHIEFRIKGPSYLNKETGEEKFFDGPEQVAKNEKSKEVVALRKLAAMLERIDKKHPELRERQGYVVTALDPEGLIDTYTGRTFTRDDLSRMKDEIEKAVMALEGIEVQVPDYDDFGNITKTDTLALDEDILSSTVADFDSHGFDSQYGMEASYPQVYAELYKRHKQLVDDYKLAYDYIGYSLQKKSVGLSYSMNVVSGAPMFGIGDPLVGINQIIRDLAREANLTLRQGPGLGRRYGYNWNTGVIRQRIYYDVNNLSLNAGEALEQRLGRGIQTIIRRHAVELTGSANPKPEDITASFRQFIQSFLLHPASAQQAYPNFLPAFRAFVGLEDANLLASLDKAQTAIQTFQALSPTEAVESMVQPAERPTAVDRFINGMLPENRKLYMGTALSKLYRAAWDEKHPFYLATRELLLQIQDKRGERRDLKTVENPYKLLRLATSSHAWAQRDILDGIQNRFTRRHEGKGLADILAVALGSDRQAAIDTRPGSLYGQFGAYLVARRAIVLWDRYNRALANGNPDRLVAPTLADEQTHIAAVQEFERQHPAFKQAASQLDTFLRNLLKLKRDAGVITDEQYQQLLKDRNYVPFQRSFDEITEEDLRGGGKSTSGKFGLIKRLIGSNRDVIDPIASIVQNVYETRQVIAINDAKLALLKLARSADHGGGAIAEEIDTQQTRAMLVQVKEVLARAAKEQGLSTVDAQMLDQMAFSLLADDATATIFTQGLINEGKQPIVWVYEDGVSKAVRLNDDWLGQAMFQTLTTFGNEHMNFLMMLAVVPTQIVRATITSNPSFIVRNMLVDAPLAYMYERLAVPFVTQIRGFYEAIAETDRVKQYGSNAGMYGGPLTTSLDKVRFSQHMETLIAKGYQPSLWKSPGAFFKAMAQDMARDPLGSIKSGFAKFAEYSEASETGTRAQLYEIAYKRALAQGLTEFEASAEAAFYAHDYIDYHRHGSATHAAGITKLVAFFNAAMQGMDRYYRLLVAKGDYGSAWKAYIDYRRGVGPALTAREQAELSQSARTWFMTVIIFGGASALISALFGDDERLKDVPQEIKATHWVIPLDGVMHLIPKELPGFREWAEKNLAGKQFRYPKAFETAFVANLVERVLNEAMQGDTRWAEHYMQDILSTTLPPLQPQGLMVMGGLATGIDLHTGRPIVPSYKADRLPEDQTTEYTSEAAKWLGDKLGVSPLYVDFTLKGLGTSWARDVLNINMPGLPWYNPAKPEKTVDEYFLARRFLWQAGKGSEAGRIIREMMGAQDPLPGIMSRLFTPYSRLNASAKSVKDRLDSLDPASAIELLDRLNPSERGYAIMSAAFKEKNAKFRMLHPIARADTLTREVGALQKEIIGDFVKENKSKKTEKQLVLTPEQKAAARDILTQFKAQEAHNALVITGEKGYANREMFNTRALLDELRAVSPQVYSELKRRFDARNILPSEGIQRVWPKVKELSQSDATMKLVREQKLARLPLQFSSLYTQAQFGR